MRKSIDSKMASIAAVCAGLFIASAASAATISLDPLLTGAVPSGTSAGGLAGTWFKLDNTARFSTVQHTDPAGHTDQIKNFSWGKGIWSTDDIAAMASGQNPHVIGTATTVGSVSYANNIYNNTVLSGAYGTWGEDYERTLAPIIGGANNCISQPEAQSLAQCGGELNYAAVFTGYLYVGVAGLYDFGVFADDGFSFQLNGLNGSIGMEQDSVAGRGLYELLAMNGADALHLEQGYYGIQLSHFNRLEAGVIDLGWRGPGATTWTTIDDGDLHHNVPEPASLALTCLALLGLWSVRGRKAAAARLRS